MTSARLRPMLFTSIWTSSAPGGGTSTFSIFSTLASPYSWKRTMRAMISPLPLCNLRIDGGLFVRLGVRTKNQTPLPRSERTPWQPLSKLGGCSFARFLNSVEKLMHQRPNPIHFFLQREMARVEKMELCAGNISLKEFGTFHREDSIVFAPSDQRRGLMFTEILLPIVENIQISLRIVEDGKLDILVSRPILVGLVDHPIVRADFRRIAGTMQIMPLGPFNRQKPVE